MEVEIGRGKKGRRHTGSMIAIVPSRRTRDPDDIDITWTLGLTGSSCRCWRPRSTASSAPGPPHVGHLGGLGFDPGDLDSLRGRDEKLDEIGGAPKEDATRMMQEVYAEPIKAELIAQRVEEIKAAGGRGRRLSHPPEVTEYYEIALEAGLDILVVQGTVISAEHVSTQTEPLNLKEFIASLDVPLRRRRLRLLQHRPPPDATGAVGVLVGVGPGPPAPPAASSASGSRRRPRSPTWRLPAAST